jgi:transposase
MQTQSNKLDFNGQNIYVGLDVHLRSWKVTIMTDYITHKTFSQPPKTEALYNYLERNFPGGVYHSAYEAGFCGYWIHNKLVSLGIKSMVVNPADVPTTNKERVQKEDKRDSKKIARSLRNGELTPIFTPSIKTLEDRALLRTRSTVVKDLTRYKNRIKSFLYFHGIEVPESFAKPQSHWSKRFMNWLEVIELPEESGKMSLNALLVESKHLRVSVLDLTRQVRKLSETDNYKANAKLLRSIPGIGLITTMTILTELETILRFNNIDKLCSFIGLVPSTSSSGEKDRTGKITPRGNGILRSAIVESSWMAVRNDPALMMSYLEYCKRMEPNKAIIRIAKKLLNRIKYVLKNNQPYVSGIVNNN